MTKCKHSIRCLEQIGLFLFLLASISLSQGLLFSAEEKEKVRFNQDIRPILSEYCFSCHGPDAKNAKGDLRLDSLESALAGKAFVPGQPEKSELIARVMTTDQDDIMPPPETHKTLKPEEKALLKQWIAEGAHWEKHWAFVKPSRPNLPNKNKSNNPIDTFIQKKLKTVGLKQNTPLNKYALARRTSFDLIGLPPEWKDVEAFVQDDSEKAFENYVNTLLEKPQYGEHQARFWMDAARYGDTHGMHLDNYREIWPYRDWVIKAFNKNMPFNQFVIEQISGDLLPNPSDQQLIATGFNRCNITTAEGGAIPEELDVRYMVDRVETVGTVFLGLSMGCASCHDHKFDPISQKEFYEFAAFFNNTTQPAMDGNQKDSPPVFTLPPPRFQNEWQVSKAKRDQAFNTIHKHDQRILTEKKLINERHNYSQEKDYPISRDGLSFEALIPNQKTQVLGQATKLIGSGEADPKHPLGKASGVMIKENNKDGLLVETSPTIHSQKPFSISMWIRTPDLVRKAGLLRLGKTVKPKKGKGRKKKPAFVGVYLELGVQGNIKTHLSFKPHKNIQALLPEEMATKPNRWQHFCVRYSGGQSKSSIRMAVDGVDLPLRLGNDALFWGNDAISGNIRLGQGLITGGLSHVRIYNRWVNENELKLLANEFKMKDLIENKNNEQLKNEPNENIKLLNTWYTENKNQELKKARQVIAETQTRRDFMYARSTTTLISEEKKYTKPVAYVLERGEYDKRGEKVHPFTPKVLHHFKPHFAKNRLGLSQWLTDKENPLIARVTMNRLWESLFGLGLVKTMSDFGTMGSPPSHPELLDWLAVEFMDSGWDIKHMLRLMVSSQTYQANAKVSEKSYRIDPDNKWLSRGPRVRLDAEEIRDQALAVSGLLVDKLGGPSVKPYQPNGLWRVVAFGGSNTGNFRRDKGENLYRRSLYTFWKRTSPPPSMEAFNAPTRENCTVSRERTNTPLQALVLMNDPQFIEAARVLAGRTLKQNDVDDEVKLKWMFKEVFKRPYKDVDINQLKDALGQFRLHFKKSDKVATELIKVGESKAPKDMDILELASWTMLANTLMNRDDFINKD